MDLRKKLAFGSDVHVKDLPDDHQADLHDWPIQMSELETWYDLAESLIGIAGAPGSGLPPLRMNKAEKHVDAALRAAGHRAEVIHAPMAINSGKHGGRNACRHSGLCQDYACRFEAKSDMRVTLLRDAEKSRLLTIQPLTFVRHLHTDGRRVTAVECIVDDPFDGKVEIYSAPIVVVACEVVETIRLLMASGIGNPDVIGRYVMYHVTGGARSLAPIWTTTWDNAPHTGVGCLQRPTQCRKLQDACLQKGRWAVCSIIVEAANVPSSSGKTVRRRVWGQRAKMLFEEVYPRKMDYSYIGEGLPTAYNRVELTEATVRDRYGMRGTIISYSPHPFDLNAGKYMEQQSKDILRLVGGVTIDEAPERLKPFLVKETSSQRLFHGSGGCRFGEDAKTSVLDPECRVHELDNLYVADASFMPTGTGVNPTLTVQANALRVGAKIVERFGRMGTSSTRLKAAG